MLDRGFFRRMVVVVGTLLLAFGNGGVAISEQSVSSGLAALMVAVVPLWMALFSGLWGRWPSTKDWFALALGFLVTRWTHPDGS